VAAGRIRAVIAEPGLDGHDRGAEVGGIIPDADRSELARLGAARVVTPGATTEEIVSRVREHVGAAVE
jgi:isobutyryl-CoA mutase small subunit